MVERILNIEKLRFRKINIDILDHLYKKNTLKWNLDLKKVAVFVVVVNETCVITAFQELYFYTFYLLCNFYYQIWNILVLKCFINKEIFYLKLFYDFYKKKFWFCSDFV